ncbi:carbohydrate ABC transporter membrane protein 1 (CUT1 family) [Aureibacillus halotolerans]|uniref:Carbohydrate ABC transporter membrane protein 1 (CUT1 family) n=1 Tax=Aureibacillus halotolerans TaxID=1508390 RepID=A0A4R6TYR9_9BACI|nr:carbohydrate ABC transporter membrane protein 1 (CUT1 family) [Aureibacillus halotolerans]
MAKVNVSEQEQSLLYRTWKKSFLYPYWKNKYLTILLLPTLLFFALFHYGPLYGLQIAFKEYNFFDGIWGSAWVGMQHFERLFEMQSFWEVFRNTIIISFYKFLFGFPAPIIFALLLNELRHAIFKRVVQTISYFPHFVSWVILAGIFTVFLSPSMGPINIVLKAIGLDPIYFLADTSWFRTVLVSTEVWKDLGWGTIIYLAALSGVNTELYEVAKVDGANRFQRVWHVTLPALVPVITIMMVLSIGKLINDDFDQVFNLYNPAVYSVGDVLSTYTYRQGLVEMQYSFATAVGLFKNLIALVMVLSANWVANRLNNYGLW